jgi:sugar/nucleoside kinase (ribokinase family)
MSASPSPSAWDVVGVGANSVDTVYVLPEHPRADGTRAKLPILQRVVCCGGQTATALATCARLGLRSAYVGATGNDANGRRIAAVLRDRGVEAAPVVRESPNPTAVILIDAGTGERLVLWHRPEGLALAPAELPLETIAGARLLHVDDVDQAAAVRAAQFARGRGILVTSDLERMTDATETLVHSVTCPIFAEHLPSELTGHADQEQALRKLRRTHPGWLVVTLGSRGAVALEGDRLLVSPGVPVKAVDTTGSGDVFRGAFIYGLLNDWPLARILRFANAAAAVSCTRLGAMNGVPARAEIDALIEGGDALS